MNSFPMVARCANSQWCGLEQHEREWLVQERDIRFAPNDLKKEPMPSVLWGVVNSLLGEVLMLISIKYDA